METLIAGTLAGTGSFRCETCGHTLTLAAADALPDCPGCAGRSWVRASLFSGSGSPGLTGDSDAGWVAGARAQIEAPGEYVAYEDDDRTIIVPLKLEWTRVGRSLAANIRLDDPTISRRHALIVRGADGVRVLDDRSLNGVFVNGRRVEWSRLEDGDEIVVGRYRLHFLCAAPVAEAATAVTLSSS